MTDITALATRLVRGTTSPTRWIAFALVASLASATITVLGLVALGEPFGRAFEATAPAHSRHLLGGSETTDSWGIMLAAYQRRHASSGAALYAPFHDGSLKFQYPPSSLLILDVLPSSQPGPGVAIVAGQPTVQGSLRVVTGLASQLATIGLILGSVLLFELSVRRLRLDSGSRRERALRCVLAFALGCCYYPVVKGHSLGQIQVFLNGLAALSILAALLGRDALAGAALGLCSLVKPQCGLVLLWSVARGRWRFTTGFVAVAAVGLMLAVARYGWRDHVDYLSVLVQIASHGEVYWANQSVNGLFHRFLGNGDPREFSPWAYAPSNDLVNLATTLSSVALLLVALWPRYPRGDSSRRAHLDLLIAIVMATMAAPVVWEHHYGVLLPVFAAATPPLLMGTFRQRPAKLALLLAFVATGSAVLRPELFFANRWTGLLGSHLFFGGLVLLAVMVLARQSIGRVRGRPQEAILETPAVSEARSFPDRRGCQHAFSKPVLEGQGPRARRARHQSGSTYQPVARASPRCRCPNGFGEVESALQRFSDGRPQRSDAERPVRGLRSASLNRTLYGGGAEHVIGTLARHQHLAGHQVPVVVFCSRGSTATYRPMTFASFTSMGRRGRGTRRAHDGWPNGSTTAFGTLL